MWSERLPPYENVLDCKTCSEAHEFRKKLPPCDTTCPRPTVLGDNNIVIGLYNICKTQVIVSFGGIVDLRYDIVLKILDLYRVPEDRRVEIFERIRNTFHYFLQEQNLYSNLQKK